MINSLPYKNQQELNYLGYTKIGVIGDDRFHAFKQKSMQLIKETKSKYPKLELFNLINATHDIKTKSNNLVREYFVKYLEDVMGSNEIEIYPVSHIVKPFGLKSSIWHQDSSIVDENDNFSLNAWVSFVDSTKLNGCLWILPGSHINSNHYRQFGFNPVEGAFKKYLKPYMKPVKSKAGEVLLFHRNLFHGSGNNFLPFKRVAAEAVITNSKAQLFNYHRDENLLKHKILAYKVDFKHYLKPDPKEDFYSGLVDRVIYEDVTKKQMIANIKAELPLYIKHASKISKN